MDISTYVASTGEFLKADTIRDGDVAIITGEAQIVHNEKFNVDRLHIPIEIETKAFIFDCSKTNSRVIAETLGEDTLKWVRKQIVLEKYRTKTSDGKMVEAINIKEIRA